jgi:hypothetical protein
MLKQVDEAREQAGLSQRAVDDAERGEVDDHVHVDHAGLVEHEVWRQLVELGQHRHHEDGAECGAEGSACWKPPPVPL